jgi:hypothetical protein
MTKISRVPVCLPKERQWLRTHPDPNYRGVFALYERFEQYFLIDPAVASKVPHDAYTVHTANTDRNRVFLWPIRIKLSGVTDTPYFESMRATAEFGTRTWTQLRPSRFLAGAYEVGLDQRHVFAEPVWPNIDFRKLMKIAFRNYVISNLSDFNEVKYGMGLTLAGIDSGDSPEATKPN